MIILKAIVANLINEKQLRLSQILCAGKMVSVKTFNFHLTISCFLGLGLSIYAYLIELATQENKDYTALCDISEHVSCTKAFKSKYARGFGFAADVLGKESLLNKPNSLLGIIFYSVLAILVQSSSKRIVELSLLASILSCVASAYFAYILYFILYDLCIICVSTYVVNFTNLALNFFKLQAVKDLESEATIKKKQH